MSLLSKTYYRLAQVGIPGDNLNQLITERNNKREDERLCRDKDSKKEMKR